MKQYQYFQITMNHFMVTPRFSDCFVTFYFSAVIVLVSACVFSENINRTVFIHCDLILNWIMFKNPDGALVRIHARCVCCRPRLYKGQTVWD